MMKTVLLLMGFFATAIAPTNTPKKLAVFHNAEAENEWIKVYAVDIVSNPEITKFKLRIQNKTQSVLLFNPEKSSFLVHGNEVNAEQEKQIRVNPDLILNKVISIKNPNGLVTDLGFKMDGLSLVALDAPALDAAPFALPATVNQFRVGNFEVQFLPKDSEVSNKKTELFFEVKYLGDKMGVVQPKYAALSAEGREYAVLNTGLRSSFLAKGESSRFVLKWIISDRLVKLNKSTAAEVVWRNTFSEVESKPLEGIQLKMTLNEKDSK